MAETGAVQSLDRAFALLELLCTSRDGMSIAALTEQTGLHKSTIHRLLASMAARGYVQQDTQTSRYHAGMKLCELSSCILENFDILSRARAPMDRLHAQTSETVHLVMREGQDIVYIQKVEGGTGAIRMFSRIGMRRPLYCTGVGKAILATLPEAEVLSVWKNSRIEALTPHTIIDKDAFLQEIQHIRRVGYALDNEENELGVRCIAAAIADYRGRAAYALSISAPLARMTDEHIRQLRQPLLTASHEIAALLGG